MKRVASNLIFTPKRLRAAIGLAAVVGAAVFRLIDAPAICAQSPPRQAMRLPTFDVALIIPSRSRGAEFSAPAWGEFMARDVTTRYLIEYAYDINASGRASSDDQLVGGPEWVDFEKYDVDAKVEDSLAKRLRKLPPEKMEEQMRLMLQSLLADQFNLKVHRETKTRPVYALTPAQGGPKFLQASLSAGSADLRNQDFGGKEPPLAPAGQRRLLLRGSMSQFAVMLSRDPDIGRTVLDQTGIKGNYECVLDLPQPQDRDRPSRKLRDGKGKGATWDAPQAGGPPEVSIFTAIQSQLGLRLESTTGPVDVVVIDYIERPAEN